MTFYTCYPVNKNSSFYKSAYCSEGYDSKKDAIQHKKFFEEHFNEKFIIEKEKM